MRIVTWCQLNVFYSFKYMFAADLSFSTSVLLTPMMPFYTDPPLFSSSDFQHLCQYIMLLSIYARIYLFSWYIMILILIMFTIMMQLILMLIYVAYEQAPMSSAFSTSRWVGQGLEEKDSVVTSKSRRWVIASRVAKRFLSLIGPPHKENSKKLHFGIMHRRKGLQ